MRLHICAGSLEPSILPYLVSTVKPVLSGHSKLDKTKVLIFAPLLTLKTYVSLMKVEGIAECSLGAFCNTFDLH